MRKALLALMMIAAAFSGGAVVNGPGLAWIQALARTLANKSEFVKVVDPPKGAPASDADPLVVAASADEPKKEVPAAPMPPLVINRPQPAGEAKESAPVAASADARPAPAAKPEEPVETAAAPPPPAALPKTAVELASPLPPPVSEAPPRDGPLTAVAAPSEIQPPPPPRSEPTRDPAAGRTVFASDTPRTGRAEPASASVPDQAPRGKTSDWAGLRKRLADAGVSRFEVEAEIAGRVRFRCVIPIAGRRAVAQMFEGEGNDEFQAAESALKRIQLWRVSEGTGTN